MLKLSLIVMFALSLGTISFASSMVPSPGVAVQPAWIHTFE